MIHNLKHSVGGFSQQSNKEKGHLRMPEVSTFRIMNWRGPRLKWGCMEWSLAVAGLVAIVVTVAVMKDSKQVEDTVQAWQGEEAPLLPLVVNLTLVEAAASKGAFCLDGTLPGYHLDQGFGSGSNSWLIHLEGGGWCNNLASCSMRKRTHLGSSLHMEKQIVFSGILSNKPFENPDFYNWNRVKVRYCDGASYSGDVEDVNQEYKIFFRGQRIWKAVMEDLLAKGMDKANQGLLSGCSAGGLASFLHCDNFRELLPQQAQVKCLGDGGFFVHKKDISGAGRIESFYNEVVTMQGVNKHLPKLCTSQMDPRRCIFPQYFLHHIGTPFFILNPAYDYWQIQNILAPDIADPQGLWQKCKQNIKSCTKTQLSTLQDFRIEMLNAMKEFKGSKTQGMFINSCFIHCQSEMQQTWFSQDSPRLHNKTIAEAVGDWYFDRTPRQYIDCAYPCDSTCYNVIRER
ncbi:pectin acetylesterase 8 isoform X2 [Cryptomeria japonica]|uniref:pectin acetylesterase 8 isoform X2 n=1 Tax=Cryptomeria japonica TaxID=3369 RepID=UPI0027DAAF1F|nr:pectin acetylesterase 8 isoform X2 [Cryptomeria japonica]